MSKNRVFSKKVYKVVCEIKNGHFKNVQFQKIFQLLGLFFSLFFIKIIINIINIIITYTNIMIRQKERNLNLWCQNMRVIRGIIMRII